MTFTDQQIAAFRRFVKVQKSNRYNMITPQARDAARITRKEQIFIIENYEALAKVVEAQEKTG